MGEILDTFQAAEFLGVQAQTLRRYRSVGGGPRYARLGGRSSRGPARYQLSDLLAWLEGRKVSSVAEEEAARAATA